MIDVQAVHFAYGHQQILKDLSLSVTEGEIVALVGVSGSGKTTLFRLIAGLIHPTEGRITVAGRTSLEGGYSVAYMCQEDLLLPWRTVLGNLSLCAELGARRIGDKKHVLQTAHTLLAQVGLEKHAQAYPYELSGGLRQRAALARTLLQNRPVILCDEPFASLDVLTREQLYLTIREIRDRHQKTIVMVTHDFRDAWALADRILVLSGGRIADCYAVTPEVHNDPRAADQLVQRIRERLAPNGGSCVR